MHRSLPLSISLRRLFAAVLSAMLLAALAAPVGAADADPCLDDDGNPTHVEQQVWFHEGESKVGNLADRGVQEAHPWSTTAPEASVTDGAGAGALGTGGGAVAAIEPTAEAQGAAFAGTFDGCLDTMLLELYAATPTNRTGTESGGTPGNHNMGIEIVIDGAFPITLSGVEGQTVENENGNATQRVRLAITDLQDAMERRKLDPTAAHTIEIRVAGWFVNTDHVVYLWDTTEVPAGIIFNGTPDESWKAASVT